MALQDDAPSRRRTRQPERRVNPDPAPAPARPWGSPWALRDMRVGAVIGLVLPLCIFPSTIPPVFLMPLLGAMIGPVFGCATGTFLRRTERGALTARPARAKEDCQWHDGSRP